MKNRIDAEREWTVELPPGMDLFVQETRDTCQLDGGEIVPLPFPPLAYAAIVDAKLLAEDWEIPTGLVPIMGDFHNLVCLDYRSSAHPSVVLIDDDRTERELFNSFDKFLGSLRTNPEKNVSAEGIIKEESWLDF